MELLDTFKREALWFHEFINELSSQIQQYFLVVKITKNSCAPILYEVSDRELKHSNQLNSILFDKYIPCFKSLKNPGVYIFRYKNHLYVEQKYISYYNVDLFHSDLFELLLFQEFGLYPAEEYRKQVLKESLKAEKIKKTLVYACYLNDNEHIMNCLEKTSKAQLNKKFGGCTPLGICAENNNIEGFKAIAKKGADLNKRSSADRPLRIAFQYSPDIVLYIYENYREQFDKEVKAEGFKIACHTTDIRLLQLLKEYGCDMNCAGNAFPPLHNFADYNNVVAIQYFADNGADLWTLNQYKQTALDRAKRQNNTEAIKLLELLTGQASPMMK